MNLRLGKVIAGIALLLLAVVAAYRFSRQSPGLVTPEKPVASPGFGLSPRHVNGSEAPILAVHTQELVAVDFDWRQTLTNHLTPPRLPREEVEKYLARNDRNAVSLLAAYRALRDTNYLVEAATNFPNDPRVQLGVLAGGLFPEDRRKSLDLFKASSPDNPLANYLSARDYFKNGQTADALNEVFEAEGKTGFRNYAMESKLDEEELNTAAGRSPMQARLSSAGWAEDLGPQFVSLKVLAQDLAALQRQYLGAGDAVSGAKLARAGMALASGLETGDGGSFAIEQLIAHSIEAITLSPLDLNGNYDFLDGKTPAEKLAELKQQKALIGSLRQNFRETVPEMTEAELLSYTERQRLYGEVEAMRWLQQRRAASGSPEGSH